MKKNEPTNHLYLQKEYLYNMEQKELFDIKSTVVTIDESLDKYNDMPIFQEKLDKANEAMRNIDLSEIKKLQSQG